MLGAGFSGSLAMLDIGEGGRPAVCAAQVPREGCVGSARAAGSAGGVLVERVEATRSEWG
eukprot:COSAG01_NODE_8380_length_2807_cov_3.481905_4_plen_60_part_00